MTEPSARACVHDESTELAGGGTSNWRKKCLRGRRAEKMEPRRLTEREQEGKKGLRRIPRLNGEQGVFVFSLCVCVCVGHMFLNKMHMAPRDSRRPNIPDTLA